MNTRAKAAFSTADTLAVAKANCAPKRNPSRPRGGSKSTETKRKEPATPTPKLKAPDKGPSEPKPDPEKSIEKAFLPSSTPVDPKKARKGRQGPGSTPPGISSLKEAVIGGNPKGDPEAADSPRTPGDNPPVILLGQQTPSENGDDEFPDPSKKIDFGANLAQSEESSDDTFKPSSSDHDGTTDDDDDDDDDVTGFQDASDVEDNGDAAPDDESSDDKFVDAKDEEEDEKKLAEAKEAFNKAVEEGPEEYARLLVTYVHERATILTLMEADYDSVSNDGMSLDNYVSSSLSQRLEFKAGRVDGTPFSGPTNPLDGRP